MGNPFKAGDYVVRISHGTSRVKLGKVYQVAATSWWDGKPRIRFTGEDGSLLTSCPSLYRHATEGEINMSQYNTAKCAPAPAFAPHAPYMAAPQPPGYVGQQVSVEEMRALADRVEAEQDAHAAVCAAEKADREARIATNDALSAHTNLAYATITLLGMIRQLLVERVAVPGQHADVAKHRKALAGLADVYGCKIVLVGDKTTATVVKV